MQIKTLMIVLDCIDSDFQESVISLFLSTVWFANLEGILLNVVILKSSVLSSLYTHSWGSAFNLMVPITHM